MERILKEKVTIRSNDVKSGIGGDYTLQIYQGKADNEAIIELTSDSDIRFLYRLKLDHHEYEKIRRENRISRDDEGILKYIKDFVRALPKNHSTWLESSIATDKFTLIMMRESDLGSRIDLALPLIAVKSEEFIEYLIGLADKCTKAWKKAESDATGYQRKASTLQKENEKLKEIANEADDLKRRNQRLEAEISDQREEHQREIERLMEQLQDLEEENRINDEDADKLKVKNEELEEELAEICKKYDDLEDKYDILKEEHGKYETAVKKLYAKGKKTEDELLKKMAENEKLESKIEEFIVYARQKKADLLTRTAECESLRSQLTQKDKEIAALTAEVDCLTHQLDLKDKLLEGQQKLQTQKR